jgi:hypothetical protein
MKKKYKRKTTFEKKKEHQVSSGFARVMGPPAGSTRFRRVVTPACLLTNPNSPITGSTYQAGPGLITMNIILETS